MERSAAALGFALGFAGSWLLAALTRLPLLWYLPLAHRWELARTVEGLGMDYFGRLLFASAAGALGAGLAWLLGRRPPLRWLPLGAAGLGALVALDLVVQLAQLR